MDSIFNRRNHSAYLTLSFCIQVNNLFIKLRVYCIYFSSREPYSCIHHLADLESVVLLAVSKLMSDPVMNQIREININHANAILRDCIFLLTGSYYSTLVSY